MFALLMIALCYITWNVEASKIWKLRPLTTFNSAMTLEQRKKNTNQKEVVIVGASAEGFETLSTQDNGNSWTTLSIPKKDYTVVNNNPKDRLNFENLPFNFVSQSIVPYGETGMAISGRFYYLHSKEYFNGIALKNDIASNSWRLYSLSTNITEADELVLPTHSSFPTKETWYTVLSTVPSSSTLTTMKAQKNNNYVAFDVHTGTATTVQHPFSKEQQEKLPSNKQLLAVYKTTTAGQEWDKVFELKEETTTSFVNDFQCYDDLTCVIIIERLDGTATVLKTKNGGKDWATIYSNKDAEIQFQSVFVQGPDNVWLVAQGNNNNDPTAKKSILFHASDFGDEPWAVIDPEVEGLQKIFFYNGGEGYTDDDYRFVEGLIVTETKDGQQLLQQIIAY